MGAIKNVLRNVAGVGEDPKHLVSRLPDCSGQSHNALTRATTLAQLKFAIAHPYGHEMCWGQTLSSHTAEWDNVNVTSTVAKAITKRLGSGSYSPLPYANHEEYIATLKAIALRRPSEVNRENGKGRSAMSILKTAAAYAHYAYLQNGASHRATINPQ